MFEWLKHWWCGEMRAVCARSSKWPKVRAAHLKAEPTCRGCGGTRSLQVHHIVPVHIDAALELEESNLITLCEYPGRNCHFTWGHFYNWADFNSLVRQDTAWWTFRQSNRDDIEPAP